MRIQHLLFKPLVIEKCDDGDMVRVSLCVTVRPVWGRAAAVEIQILWLHPSRPRHHNINPVSHFTLHLSQLQSSARFDLECPCLGSANQRPVSAWHQPITGAENRVFTELSAVLATSLLYRQRRDLGEVPCQYPHSKAKARLWLEVYLSPKVPCVWRPTIPDVLADSVSVRAAVRGCGVRMRAAAVESGMIAPCSVAVSMPAEKHLPGHPAPGHPPQPPTEQAIHYK